MNRSSLFIVTCTALTLIAGCGTTKVIKKETSVRQSQTQTKTPIRARLILTKAVWGADHADLNRSVQKMSAPHIFKVHLRRVLSDLNNFSSMSSPETAKALAPQITAYKALEKAYLAHKQSRKAHIVLDRLKRRISPILSRAIKTAPKLPKGFNKTKGIRPVHKRAPVAQ